jgi:3-oxoacyl-(acyl-carrier-protein) synthase
MGVVSPLGNTVHDFWRGLLQGQSGIVALDDIELSKLPTRIGARAVGYDTRDYFDHKEARRMSRASQMAVIAAGQAIAASCLTKHGGVGASEVGTIVASSIGGFAASDPLFGDFYMKGRSSPLIIPVAMNHGPSSHISMRYGFEGPVISVDAACSSAAHAIGYAYNLIRTGLLEVAVTGGSDCPFAPAVMMAWSALGVLSERNDNPSEACRPFSADRDGLVLGEGAAILVLETESSALRRSSRILAEIVGYGASGDSNHLTRPTKSGAAKAMRRALADAGLAPERVDYINAHATGTLWNDKNETAAIKEVLGRRAYDIPVVGNKSGLGHAIGASPALEFISSVLSLHDQRVPPTINYRVKDPDCDLDYVVGGDRAQVIRYAMSNSFAFGGSNAVIIVKNYEPA